MKKSALIIVVMTLLVSTSVFAQLKIGDKHPEGGIIFSLDASGRGGMVVQDKDLGKFTQEEAINACKALGSGWGLPSIQNMELIYSNLYLKGLGGFEKTKYRSVTSSGYPSYPWAMNFATGKKEGEALGNKTNVRAVKAFTVGNSLTHNQFLTTNQKIFSANGAYYLIMQEDGNVVIYTSKDNKPIWATQTHHKSKGGKFIMQTDGNLVLYNPANNQALWSSKTHPYYDKKFASADLKPEKAVLENDGALVLYARNNNKVWSSK